MLENDHQVMFNVIYMPFKIKFAIRMTNVPFQFKYTITKLDYKCSLTY